MTYTHLLLGCQPEPIGSYLKALGILRLVAEQADPQAAGGWTATGFRLDTSLDSDGLQQFFLHDYIPTPIISPWNKGSGFYSKDNTDAIEAIDATTEIRFAPYQATLAVGRRLVAQNMKGGYDKKKKPNLLLACRSELPDASVTWMDAAVVLVADAPAYPPLLGSGGNDGHLDFSNNFMQRIVQVFVSGVKRPNGASPEAWVSTSLFGGGSPGVKAAIGQFDPGAAGGPNSSPLGRAESLVNPFDFVLLVEGSLLFAGGAARRLGATASKRAAMPFTFSATPVGYPSAAAEDGRGEIWAPLWSTATGLGELTRLFGEARVSWAGRQAHSGLDAARGAVTLGIDRGVSGFARHALVTRNGRATVAVPAGRVATVHRPEVGLLATLDRWLDRVRRADVKTRPAGVATAMHGVERNMYRAAGTGGSAALLEVLVAVAELEGAVGRATTFRENNGLLPLNLSGEVGRRWGEIALAEASAVEERLAVSLASLRDPGPAANKPMGRLRFLIRPVVASGTRLGWGSPPVAGFGTRPLVEVLASAHTRRFTSLDTAGAFGSAPFGQGVWATTTDVAALCRGRIDERRLAELLGAFMLIDWSDVPLHPIAGDLRPDGQVGAVGMAVLAPFYRSRAKRTASPSNRDGPDAALCAESSWASQLESGRVTGVLEAALRRLRIARTHPVVRAGHVDAGVASGAHLSAGLLCRLADGTVEGLRLQVCPAPLFDPDRRTLQPVP